MLQNFIDNWEQMLFVLALLLLLLFGSSIALLSGTDNEDENSTVRKIAATRYFKWDENNSPFAPPVLPDPNKANPFAHSLVAAKPKEDKTPQKNLQPTPPPEPPQKPKDDKTIPTVPKTQQKPKKTVTIEYRGLYVSLDGVCFAMLSASNSDDKATKPLRVRMGQTFLNDFTLTAVSDDEAIIQTANGQLKSIRWNASSSFELK